MALIEEVDHYMHLNKIGKMSDKTALDNVKCAIKRWEKERKELKEMGREINNMSDRLYWYVARDNLGLEMPDGAEERLSFNHLGYISKPSGEIIKKYDLELVGRLTRSELFDKYF